MIWKFIVVPVIGAVIGYVTNWIAVKMLFRPHHEVHILGCRLPFTPGVIPRGQGRLARAVGRAVEEQLLTQEVLGQVLLSDEMKETIKKEVSNWVCVQEQSEKTIGQAAGELISKEAAADFFDRTQEQITDIVCRKLKEMNPGRLVADKVLEAAKEKLEESMFGMMLGSSFLEPIAKLVEEKINEYLQEYGREYIEETVSDEIETIQNKTVGDLFLLMKEQGVDIPSIMVSVYETLVMEKLPDAMRALHLSGIVEDRINSMEVAQVEELLLSIMKKELKAVVNLGAFIGFLLGFINVVILCI